MEAHQGPQEKRSKSSSLAFLTWWQPDPNEVARQVAEYDTLKITKSARGVSALLCMFSATVTLLLGRFLNLSSLTVVLEAVIWSAIALAMYNGLRAAFMAGMILWTIEKVSMIFSGMSTGRTPIVQIIWWFLYMNSFYLAWKVEGVRRTASAPAKSG